MDAARLETNTNMVGCLYERTVLVGTREINLALYFTAMLIEWISIKVYLLIWNMCTNVNGILFDYTHKIGLRSNILTTYSNYAISFHDKHSYSSKKNWNIQIRIGISVSWSVMLLKHSYSVFTWDIFFRFCGDSFHIINLHTKIIKQNNARKS